MLVGTPCILISLVIRFMALAIAVIVWLCIPG